ncbi:ribosomal protein S18-alanine N-acetyltransferase [Halochromatium salexigens]|nr:ribosomal protein S18-alanine N-acetyltransferase [Halochromatium salexigens]
MTLPLTPERAIALRRMTEADLTEVMQVECAAYAVPWSEGIFRDCLRASYYCLVADRAGRLIGHAVMSVAAGECHILNLCVAPSHQGRGLGRRLLRRALALARQREADTAFLEVRASNQGAIRLYQAEGFDEIGLRKGYYPSADANAGPGTDSSRASREDAVLMARAL